MPRQARTEEFLKILQAGSASGYISGQDLARKTRISRSAIWKQVTKLRKHGYKIESLHGKGYRFRGQTESPVPWELARLARTSFVGNRKIIYREGVDSTQSIAIGIAEKDENSHGMVVIAEQQKGGRGRLKRRWLSPRGGIWLSIILKPAPTVPITKMTLLPFAAALAVCGAIKENTLLDARLKWPNDVMVSGRKVAGILLDVSAEADRVNYAVIGIGINANVDSSAITSQLENNDRMSVKVTSLKEEIGKDVNRLKFTATLLEKIEHYFTKFEEDIGRTIVEEWKKNSDLLGRKVSVIQQGSKTITGIASDIGENGSMLLRTEDGETISIVSGDIAIRY